MIVKPQWRRWVTHVGLVLCALVNGLSLAGKLVSGRDDWRAAVAAISLAASLLLLRQLRQLPRKTRRLHG